MGRQDRRLFRKVSAGALTVAVSLVAATACGSPKTVSSPSGMTTPATAVDSVSGESAHDDDSARTRRERRREVRRTRTTAPSSVSAPSSIPPEVTDLADSVPRIRHAYVQCVTVPEACDRASIVVPDSPAATWLDDHLYELTLWNLARAPVADRLTIRELVQVASDRARARVCILHDLPLVDRGEPGDPYDDIPFVNPLLSIMSHWELQATAVGWRLFDVWPLGHYPESETCAVPGG